MSVYIDDYRGKFGRMIMCHMFSDESMEELHAIAQAIDLKREWFQDKGTCHHYDVCFSKRQKAIDAGAIHLPLENRQQWGEAHARAKALTRRVVLEIRGKQGERR